MLKRTSKDFLKKQKTATGNFYNQGYSEEPISSTLQRELEQLPNPHPWKVFRIPFSMLVGSKVCENTAPTPTHYDCWQTFRDSL